MSQSRNIQLEGYTRISRHEMIAKLRDAFQAACADLIDFQMFSNTAVSLIFEVRAANLEELESAILSTGLSLDDGSRELLCNGYDSDAVVSGSMNVTFIHNEPDLRIHVPPIPG